MSMIGWIVKALLQRKNEDKNKKRICILIRSISMNSIVPFYGCLSIGNCFHLLL